MTRIVGLDLSLTSTGVALIETDVATEGGWDHTVQTRRVHSKAPATKKGDPPPVLSVRSTRLRKLAAQVVELCVGADLVLVEGPSFASSGAGTWDRAGYWWMIVGRLTGGGLNVVEVPPSSLKTYATGKGNAGKDDVLAAVVLRYQLHTVVHGNDEADALVMAAMGARFVGCPIEASLPQTHLRGMTGVRWSPNT